MSYYNCHTDQGTVSYSNLRRKTHVVTVTASTVDGETVSKDFTFRNKYSKGASHYVKLLNASFIDKKFCQVYECSGGVIVDGNSANLTFTSDDDPGTTFKCKLNGRRIRPCKPKHEIQLKF